MSYRVRAAVMPQSAFRHALDEGDVAMLWRMWGKLFPERYQPANWQEAEIQLHVARAASASTATKLRVYSHYWLLERSMPSPLPDELKSKAEQFRPRIVSGVGFSWNAKSDILRAAKGTIVAAVTARIEEMAADGLLETNPDLVRQEMLFTKNKTLAGLFGNTASLTGRTAHG